MDLEVARDHDLDEQAEVLHRLRDDLGAISAPLTVFCTSEAAERFATQLESYARCGHEIGCHGLRHDPSEDFCRMTRSETTRILAEATRRIEAAQLPRPRAFRSPWMRSSSTTQRCLVELGYETDFSVCPQRIDRYRSRTATVRSFVAPRKPYSPALDSPYRRGSLPLTVMPLSSLGVPFVSGVLYLFGLRTMKLAYRALLAEARLRRSPIVYLFHSYEFTTFKTGSGLTRPRHHSLYRGSPAGRYVANLELLRHMVASPGVVPFNARSFLQHELQVRSK
jgi:peptidoglycan/xylan/chitin deacetylase (PgdA/CDA1 family)